MSNFAAEPVPMEVEAVTASYLDRQFNNIQSALLAQFVAPRAAVLPSRPILGAVIYLESESDGSENGMYACIKSESGVDEWVKVTGAEVIVPPPEPPPEVDLSGKTWDDFK